MMSPWTVRKSDSSEGLIEREVPMTVYPAWRNAATRPSPIPREAPVMTATLLPSVVEARGCRRCRAHPTR